ncbi:MAG: hypothetical protein DI535_15550 [Citrobacter freundii]|nr:MAG: hypothetical protein DI535_15550 [Citrobacter freundii]
MNNDKSNKEYSNKVTQQKEPNAGSGGFNQGSEQDPDFDKGTKVSDEEKLTGHQPSPGKGEPVKKERANKAMNQ